MGSPGIPEIHAQQTILAVANATGKGHGFVYHIYSAMSHFGFGRQYVGNGIRLAFVSCYGSMIN
jgi:hypothetical protein